MDLEGDVLTLRGEKHEARTEGDKERQYHLVERSYGTFQRSFTLPPSVEREKIRAEFDKGVLTLRMPKSKEAKSGGREIPVSGR